MKVLQTEISDLLIIEPTLYNDNRGYFFEAYNKSKFVELGINYNFIQDNQSFSNKNVIRGLHLQVFPHEQAKLVRVLDGEILDVAVDLRKDSPTYGKHFSVVLSAENKKQLMIPYGFAHGFSVLSDCASILYKVDSLYSKECELGFRYNDPTFGIDWQVKKGDEIISEKDLNLDFLM